MQRSVCLKRVIELTVFNEEEGMGYEVLSEGELIKCLRSLVRVTQLDRIRNEKVRVGAGIEKKSHELVEMIVSVEMILHVERMMSTKWLEGH